METPELDLIERNHYAAVCGGTDLAELTRDEVTELLARNGAQAIRAAKKLKRERDGAILAAIDASRERDELRAQVATLQQLAKRSMLARLLLPANAA